MLFSIELGTKVEHKVTGFKGITTGRVQYLNGCVQYLVCPKVDKDGKHVDGLWVDQEYLDIIEEKAVVVSSKERITGGDIAPLTVPRH